MRNTARFMLGNISDFDPAKDMVDDDQLFEIDRWALEACNKLTATMRDAYEHYDFSRASTRSCVAGWRWCRRDGASLPT